MPNHAIAPICPGQEERNRRTDVEQPGADPATLRSNLAQG